jgi:type IV pilus assembly protein PilC
MPQYRYQARHSSGQVQVGVLAADNAGTAAAILRNQGHHVLQLVPVQSGAAQLNKSVLKALNYSSGPGQKDILDFTTQLAVMIRAGISLRAALDGIGDQISNPKFRKILQSHQDRCRVGQAVFRGHRQVSAAVRSVVRQHGARIGNVRLIREDARPHRHLIGQQIETKKMVIGASIYPGIIATMAISVTIFLMTFVLPRFAGVFQGHEASCPGPPSSSWGHRTGW